MGHSVGNTGVHGGASRHDGVGALVLLDVNTAVHDGIVDGLVDSSSLPTKEGRVAPESLPVVIG